jgi:hypothetical protein
MASASQASPGPIGGPIQALFGSDDPPREVFQRYVRPELSKLRDLGLSALKSLGTGGAAAEKSYNLGTDLQRRLMGEQEGVSRQLLSRALNFDPNRMLGDIGKTAFSFIDPNVVSPLAKFDVNYDRLSRMARGLNPAAIDSTSDRLRNARVASGRYYDVARNVYGALPNLYNQALNSGLTYANLAQGYLPQLMSGYRALDRGPLDAALLRDEAANAGARGTMLRSQANKMATYGYQQPENWADKIGQADAATWNTLKDAIQMAGSVYGMIAGGGAGGMLGGMMGGGGGGGGAAPRPGAWGQQGQPSFIPSPQYYGPPAQMGPGGTYNPGPPVQSYDLPPQQYQPGGPQYPQGWFPG